MFPGLNPKKMQSVMKQMGISQEIIDAKRVVIEREGGNIVIEDPEVVKINMQGQTNFQISGDIMEEGPSQEDEEEDQDATEEDIKTIIEKTNCSEDQAKSALETANNDLTEAILSLS
ncbi:nascent polypeptide-associated complex protein [Candidatus Pacearchaeota archaeon]|nr:nascent polypeptide-associated complex protein [Candidatus Pacearchaeota archaeon]